MRSDESKSETPYGDSKPFVGLGFLYCVVKTMFFEDTTLKKGGVNHSKGLNFDVEEYMYMYIYIHICWFYPHPVTVENEGLSGSSRLKM